ncbi:Hint domain-containing protein [Nioella sp.]|uniref:Hint domain-containing protein n=1 Tax=Nioella sp. TaxID=1912091 RepID=UPI003A8704BC
MAIWTVTSLGDVTDGSDGVLTLREAVTSAGSGDTIVFDASLSGGTVSLSQGVMTISNTITISGDVDSDGAADITIDGNAAQIFTVQSGGALSLNALTVTDGGGFYGGAINVDSGGTLDVTASTFTGNQAGTYGGAIHNVGTTTIANSTFSGNSASFEGGAISTQGSMTIVNSTIAGNTVGGTANGLGGGIAATGNPNPNLTVINSTITGNTCADDAFGPGEGGGIYYGTSFGPVTLINTIVSGNTSTDGANLGGLYAITDGGGNVIDADPADIFGSNVLADNGGPVQTIALINSLTNPALDVGIAQSGLTAGVNGQPYTDITGAGNEGSNFTDAGAYELCFAAGSLITTPNGESTVETLRIGDTILTAEGRAVPVKWIGQQRVLTRFRPAERLGLVRFDAGSLGEDLPHADLTVTADHGMLVDGVICHAGALVNGTTITQVPRAELGETYTVYHIETEAHEIILANGAPAETFIDNVSRRVFDNYAAFEALYGDVPEMEELDYPRAMSARQVPGRIQQSLAGKQVA